MAQGTVKFFNAQKGFGFIVQDGGGPDVFVHISAVERAGMSNLNEGQKLSFDVEADSRRPAIRPRPTCRTPDRRLRDEARRSSAGFFVIGYRKGTDTMARKPGTRNSAEFALFNVVYEDGSQRSNRRVPMAVVLGGLDDDEDAARAAISEQDSVIAEKSGIAPMRITSVQRAAK